MRGKSADAPQRSFPAFGHSLRTLCRGVFCTRLGICFSLQRFQAAVWFFEFFSGSLKIVFWLVFLFSDLSLFEC